MQFTEKLNINPQPGKAVSQIPTGWFKYVNNVLKYFQVRNGRLIVDNDKWTIECGGGTNVWSLYYWFGGEVFGPVDITSPNVLKQYFGINLVTGQTAFADEPFSEDFYEWRYVADRVILNEGTPDEETIYTLSSRTCGDIVFRIT